MKHSKPNSGKNLRKNRAKYLTKKRATAPFSLKKRRFKSKRLKKLLAASKRAHKTPLGTQEFRDLRDSWYAKLKSKGWVDLEYIPNKQDHATEYMQTGGTLSNIARQYKKETLHYYRRLSTFLVYCSKTIPKRDLFILQKYSEGVKYRTISDQLKSMRYKSRMSIYSVHRCIKQWHPIWTAWNATNPKGLDFEPDIEPY